MYKFDAEKEVDYLIDDIKEYFIENGPDSKAVIGISGGKDSTITAALLVRALGAENVIGVLMPEGEQGDIADAYKVCDILKIKNYEINIGSACQRLYLPLCNAGLTMNNTITTNTPARIRMATLYMVAASVGGRVINTCNYSEDYIGYSTKYGDLAGDYSVLRKYTVREVLAMGDCLTELPKNLVHKVPSDGMCGKTDEENFGFTYAELDAYLLEGKKPCYKAHKKICKMHKRNLHKASIQIPAPTPRRTSTNGQMYKF